MDSSGNLFGTTQFGGTAGLGTVFEIVAGTNTVTTLAQLGTSPMGNLVEDSSGNLYGTTEQGGNYSDGTIFEVAAGSHTVTILADFLGLANGANPYGGLVADSSGNLYGTANSGGFNNDGCVFVYSLSSHTLTSLLNFNGTNGANPYGELFEDSQGDLLGTTVYGGADNNGTVFELYARDLHYHCHGCRWSHGQPGLRLHCLRWRIHCDPQLAELDGQPTV